MELVGLILGHNGSLTTALLRPYSGLYYSSIQGNSSSSSRILSINPVKKASAPSAAERQKGSDFYPHSDELRGTWYFLASSR